MSPSWKLPLRVFSSLSLPLSSPSPTPPHHTLGSPNPENLPIAILAWWLVCTCHWPTSSLRISNTFHESISPGTECIFINCILSEWTLNYFHKDCISIENDGLFTFCISLGPFLTWNMSYYLAPWACVSTVHLLVILQLPQQQGPWAQWHRALVCGSGHFLTHL